MGIHTFGVFVEVLPGYEGLVHISELDVKKVASVEKSGFVVGQVGNLPRIIYSCRPVYSSTP